LRELEATGQHRAEHHLIAREGGDEELASASDAPQLLADEGVQLGRSAADSERPRSSSGGDCSTGQGSVEGIGDDRQVGQFGHGRPIVAVDAPC